MIDTIKFLVPIDDIEFLQSLKSVFIEVKKENKKTEEVGFAYYSTEIFAGSYEKKIIIRLEEKFYSGFYIEFSIPKYAKGNNVEMILPGELHIILEKFYIELCFHLGVVLPDFTTWQIHRLDVCYNWIFKNKKEAETVMSFIQRIDYPRKKKSTYDTSVMYVGSAYTVKFYLKGAEFKKHDFNEIETIRATELQQWADKIVRYEVGFKRKYLEDIFECKPVLLEHIEDGKKIEEILAFYLQDKTLRYVTLKNTTEAQLEEILYANFSKVKATRLYQFYRDFYLEEGAVKSRILSGGLNRSTIYRYKKDLKSVGIGFDMLGELGESLLEKLVIPSVTSRFDLVDVLERKSEGEDNQEVV